MIENNIEIKIINESNELMNSKPNYRFVAEQIWHYKHLIKVKRIFYSNSGDVFSPENPLFTLS